MWFLQFDQSQTSLEKYTELLITILRRCHLPRNVSPCYKLRSIAVCYKGGIFIFYCCYSTYFFSQGSQILCNRLYVIILIYILNISFNKFVPDTQHDLPNILTVNLFNFAAGIVNENNLQDKVTKFQANLKMC